MKVKFQNIYKFFNGRSDRLAIAVLQNVSFEVKEAEFFCVVGPSGCGKSTIINLVAGFIFPDKGQIYVDADAVSGPSASRTVVFQDYALFPWKTVAENIGFGLDCAGMDSVQKSQAVKKLAAKVRLDQFLDRYPDELSGGMKQRVAIARALAVKPSIILMDEPFASLDQQTRDLLQEELLGFQNEFSQTIIFVTHNVEEALFLGDKVMVLSQRPGRIKTIIEVPFAKPRRAEIRNDPGFLKLKQEILCLLREEAS
jgi:NitT/TauT family transport system ATP-binding protein